MPGKGMISQIGMVVISAGVIFTYLKPAFGEMTKIQENIQTYKTEIDKVVSVNSQLAGFLTRKESVSADDQRRLLTYMPDSVDGIAVSRDLYLIALQSGVLYKDVNYSGPVDVEPAGDDAASETLRPKGYGLSLSVEGTYEQIKNLFRLIEMNNYPLEIQGVTIGKLEGGFLSVELDLVTYSFQGEASQELIF